MEAYRLTKFGRKVAGSVVPTKRNEILDYLYEHKVVTVDELEIATGIKKPRLLAILREYESKGIVEKVK